MAYTIDAMVASGVDSGVLETHGVVSQETANAMAQVAQSATAADFGIGMTGVLGPQELEGHRPGTIHIAIAHGDDVREFPLRTPPRRLVINSKPAPFAFVWPRDSNLHGERPVQHGQPFRQGPDVVQHLVVEVAAHGLQVVVAGLVHGQAEGG